MRRKMNRYCICLSILLCLAMAVPADAGQGNGAPSGPHYNLNIIGVPKEKSPDMDGNSGHRIFVKLVGNTRIYLSEGEYGVLDANGTDGRAEFQLPNPDHDNNGITEYSVWRRVLGKPGGSATMATCMYDGDGEYCSDYSLMRVRDTNGDKNKKNSFTNCTRELLYVYVDLDGDGALERYPLFSDELYGYLWDYDNQGLKLVQFRFYPIPTDVNQQ